MSVRASGGSCSVAGVGKVLIKCPSGEVPSYAGKLASIYATQRRRRAARAGPRVDGGFAVRRWLKDSRRTSTTDARTDERTDASVLLIAN